MKKAHQPGFAFGETLSISTLGPSSRLAVEFYDKQLMLT